MQISKLLTNYIPIHDEIQDNPEYWNQADVLIHDTTRATPEQAQINPKAGFENSDTGNLDTIIKLKDICDRYGIGQLSKIVELGCGGGRLCMIWDVMSRHFGMNFEIIGIDHADGAIAVCWERLPNRMFYTLNADEVDTIPEIPINLIYTNTALQHNSWWKQAKIFEAVYKALAPDGLFYLINEMTFNSVNMFPQEMPYQAPFTPFYCDGRGSAGTAAWWIARIADFGFELLEYNRSSYIFRKIKEWPVG